MRIDKYKDGDWFLGESGISYDTPQDFILGENIDGSSWEEDSQIELLIKILTIFNSGHNTWEQICEFLDEGAAYMIAQSLEVNGHLDSGISIRRSWLTDKGKLFLDDLKEL